MVSGKTTARLRRANPLERSLAALRNLCARRDSVDALLEDATQIALELLAAEFCAIVWLDETAPTLRVRARRWRDGRGADSKDDVRVIAFVTATEAAPVRVGGKERASANLERACANLEHACANLEHACANLEHACALRVSGQTVGYLYARVATKPRARATGLNLMLFDTLAEHLGVAIETQTLRQLLASRYATIALSRDGQSALDLDFLSAVRNPEQVARIIARSFYKDLRRAGFETKQILVVATELIDSLNAALRRTKAKTAQIEGGAERRPAR
jgi:hypothetical protein